MYIIGIYDIKQNRVNKVKKIFDTYLTRCQLSVYEGELTTSKYKKLISEISKVINKKEDSVILFTFATKRYIIKEVIGIEKINNTTIL